MTVQPVETRAQPIAIADMIAYLLAALDLDARGSEVFQRAAVAAPPSRRRQVVEP